MAKASTSSQLAPLILLGLFLGGAAFIAYHIYVSATKIGDAASQRMSKKNVVWTKDGVKVGVKHVENEHEVDRTQKWVVKAWNLSGNAKEPKKKK